MEIGPTLGPNCDRFGMMCQMVWRKMRISENHVVTRPSTQLLQTLKRCATLSVPASPSVPYIVKSKILDVRARARGEPLLSIPRRDPLAVSDEYKPVVLADLLAYQCDRLAVQRDADRLACFCLIWMNPCAPGNQIEFPFGEYEKMAQRSSIAEGTCDRQSERPSGYSACFRRVSHRDRANSIHGWWRKGG